MNTHISRLIAEGEHQQLDFKFEIADARKIARTFSAFANTDGGRLLVGVKDNGAIAGVRSDEEYFMLEAAAKMYCRPPVPFSIKEWRITGKTVLEVIIPKSDLKPHLAETNPGEWRAIVRVKDQNFPAPRILLRIWKNESNPKGVYLKFTEPERLLLTYLEENGIITLSKFARLARIPRRKAEDILVRFILLRMIDLHITENSLFFNILPHPPGK